MTIEELLAAAVEQVQYSLNASPDGFSTVYALRAQAAAQTAQAMILYTATSKGTDNDMPVFWLRVDNGN